MILSLITYPLSPKIKPKHTIFSNVSKLPPPPPIPIPGLLARENKTAINL